VRICVIGKFPPIQGGVSMRTYWSAHGFATRGHEVHVVTNAKEVRPPFRMHMRVADWERCNARYDAGSVTVHWTDPVDRSQAYIPMASPFVSKLAAIAARVHSEHPFDVVYSHYMEPYGVAAHLAAQIARVPHVVRMAGSDAGRLWHHPQLEALYDHVLRSAEIVIAAGTVAERAIQHGVAPDRIAFGGGLALPEDLFSPHGPKLDVETLRSEIEADPDFRDLLWGDFAADRPYFGIYGKLGESKGSFSLLAAMDRLKRSGLDVGLVTLAHGQPAVEKEFRARAQKLGLADRILQIPFLPHWRIPEFLRSCLAVCCLEQDFPIRFHTPIVAREVLLCGACLVASTEVIRKLPAHGRLPHGYGCVAIENVNDVDSLTDSLAAIVRHPAPAAAVGARGRKFARELQQDVAFPKRLEDILEAAVARRRLSPTYPWLASSAAADAATNRFRLTQLAAAAIEKSSEGRGIGGVLARSDQTIDLAFARDVLAALEKGIGDGNAHLQPLDAAVRAEIAVATAEDEADEADPVEDPLFRLRIPRWAMEEGDLAALVPVRTPQLRVVEFDHDVSAFMDVGPAVEFPAFPKESPSYVVAFGSSDGERRAPLLVDKVTARILALSDGTRTAAQIVRQLGQEGAMLAVDDSLGWIENLFLCGLLRLQDSLVSAVSDELV
jgi:glycosyltransferase involved in cell wall biosynthesis